MPEAQPLSSRSNYGFHFKFQMLPRCRNWNVMQCPGFRSRHRRIATVKGWVRRLSPTSPTEPPTTPTGLPTPPTERSKVTWCLYLVCMSVHTYCTLPVPDPNKHHALHQNLPGVERRLAVTDTGCPLRSRTHAPAVFKAARHRTTSPRRHQARRPSPGPVATGPGAWWPGILGGGGRCSAWPEWATPSA